MEHVQPHREVEECRQLQGDNVQQQSTQTGKPEEGSGTRPVYGCECKELQVVSPAAVCQMCDLGEDETVGHVMLECEKTTSVLPERTRQIQRRSSPTCTLPREAPASCYYSCVHVIAVHFQVLIRSGPAQIGAGLFQVHWKRRVRGHCFAAPSTEELDPGLTAHGAIQGGKTLPHCTFHGGIGPCPDNPWCHTREDTLPRCTFHGEFDPALTTHGVIQGWMTDCLASCNLTNTRCQSLL
ncbi:hypothetical protein E2C01_004000 [Portunus trituberculatus]|uniref:Uncharacterized protein n=1 Tax=Portunus trituberculatus TaxID=210409 RepID=A0A5B7CNQ4_PORTR|nr:hypothetical protein [Portunus trituberculatus]